MTQQKRARACLRCGATIESQRTGRPATWCSDACRRAAYEERRAAANGAIAIKVVDRVQVVEHDLTECVSRVVASPAACRRVLHALAALARERTLLDDPKWTSTLRAAEGLGDSIQLTRRGRGW